MLQLSALIRSALWVWQKPASLAAQPVSWLELPHRDAFGRWLKTRKKDSWSKTKWNENQPKIFLFKRAIFKWCQSKLFQYWPPPPFALLIPLHHAQHQKSVHSLLLVDWHYILMFPKYPTRKKQFLKVYTIKSFNTQRFFILLSISVLLINFVLLSKKLWMNKYLIFYCLNVFIWSLHV